MTRIRAIATTVLATLVSAAPASADWDSASHVPLARLYATKQIRLVHAACPIRSRACIEVSRRPVTIYLPASIPAKERAATYYHELGHAFDVLLLTDSDRSRLQRLMGNADLSWFLDDIEPNGAWITASEQFGEAFRLCAQLGPRSRSALIQLGDYDWQPTVRQQQRICRAIIRLAR